MWMGVCTVGPPCMTPSTGADGILHRAVAHGVSSQARRGVIAEELGRARRAVVALQRQLQRVRVLVRHLHQPSAARHGHQAVSNLPEPRPRLAEVLLRAGLVGLAVASLVCR